jgi:hypothetical protein
MHIAAYLISKLNINVQTFDKYFVPSALICKARKQNG